LAEDHKALRRDAQSPDDLFAIAEHRAQTWRARGGSVAAVLGKADVDAQAQKELGRVSGVLRCEFSVPVEMEDHHRLWVPTEGVTSQVSISDLDPTGRLQVARPREENAATDKRVIDKHMAPSEHSHVGRPKTFVSPARSRDSGKGQALLRVRRLLSLGYEGGCPTPRQLATNAWVD